MTTDILISVEKSGFQEKLLEEVQACWFHTHQFRKLYLLEFAPAFTRNFLHYL